MQYFLFNIKTTVEDAIALASEQSKKMWVNRNNGNPPDSNTIYETSPKIVISNATNSKVVVLPLLEDSNTKGCQFDKVVTENDFTEIKIKYS